MIGDPIHVMKGRPFHIANLQGCSHVGIWNGVTTPPPSPRERIVFQKQGVLAMEDYLFSNFANLPTNKGLHAHFIGNSS